MLFQQPVTLMIELAKLALLTSRDEDEDEADKGGTDSSNDTDATLADDVPTWYVPPEPRLVWPVIWRFAGFYPCPVRRGVATVVVGSCWRLRTNVALWAAGRQRIANISIQKLIKGGRPGGNRN